MVGAAPRRQHRGCTDDRLVGDADADKGGLITLEMFQEEFGSWPETQVHITGGGGRHYIYSGPNGSSPTVKSGDNKWGPAGDIKTGPGSYIVMPGSIHPDTRQPYTVERDADLAEAPEALLRVAAGEEQWCGTRYGVAGCAGEMKRLADTPEGSRNGTLFLSSIALGQLVAGEELDEAMARRQLEAVVGRIGFDADEKATVKSGFEKGLKEPRSAPSGNGGSSRGPSQATELIEMALTQYDLGVSLEGEPFAVLKDGPRIAQVLRGDDSLRSRLANQYYKLHGRGASPTALAQACLSLAGEAIEQERQDLWLRIARGSPGGLVYDLGDPSGQAVIVRAGAWEVVGQSPELFRRTEATGAQPSPVGGDDIAALLLPLRGPPTQQPRASA